MHFTLMVNMRLMAELYPNCDRLMNRCGNVVRDGSFLVPMLFRPLVLVFFTYLIALWIVVIFTQIQCVNPTLCP